MDSKLLHNQCVAVFNEEFYKDLLTAEHMKLEETQKPKLRYMDGEVDEDANFWGREFVKAGNTYLVSIIDDANETIDIKGMLPIMPMDVERVANPKGDVFYYVKRPVSVRFKEEQKHTPKQFINQLSALDHSNKEHQKIMWMAALSQLWDRSYYRMSTPGGCVDKDTEFLTPTGWKKISEYKEGDKVMQYNVEGRTSNFVQPTSYIKQPSGGFYNIDKLYLNQKLSKKHRVLYENWNGELKYKYAEDYFKAHNATKYGSCNKFITTFTPIISTSMDITDDNLRLMVAIIADGCFIAPTSSHPNHCSVQFKKDTKKVMFEKILKNSSIEYSKCEYKDGYTRFKFDAPMNTKVYNEDFWRCNYNQLKIINDEVTNWDGCSNQFFTSVKENADFIQYVFSSCGYRSSISVHDRRGKSRTLSNGKTYVYKSLEYTVHRTTRTKCTIGTKIPDGSHRIPFEPSEDGMEYCFTVPSSALVLRRDNKIFITKNCGKDSIIDECNALFRESGTIEGPTIAKLEERANVLKWLGVNEVVGTASKSEWDKIEQFLLAAGGHKNELTKHSRAYGNVGELIDIKNFSISLFFNDIDHYPDPKRVYFDYTTKSAVLDRFPPMRFYGQFTEDFNALNGVDVKQFVSNNMDFYKDLLYSFHYYKVNYMKHTHGFSRHKLMKMSGNRDVTNINKLLNMVDLYSDTQEEFDSWIDVINTSMEDYFCMVNNYIPAVKSFCKRFKIIIKDVFPEGSKIELDSITHYVYQEGRKEGVWIDDKFRQIYNFMQTLNLKNSTFIDVVKQLRNFGISEEKTRKIVDNKSIWETKDIEKDII